jgi:hypothetical protein
METAKAITEGYPDRGFRVEMLGSRLARVPEDVYPEPMPPGRVPAPARTNDTVRLTTGAIAGPGWGEGRWGHFDEGSRRGQGAAGRAPQG